MPLLPSKGGNQVSGRTLKTYMAYRHYFVVSVHDTNHELPSHKRDSIQFDDCGENVFISIRLRGKDKSILIPKEELKNAMSWIDYQDDPALGEAVAAERQR